MTTATNGSLPVPGLSCILVHGPNDASPDQFLASLAGIREQAPLECIILDQDRHDRLRETIEQYAQSLFIRYIRRQRPAAITTVLQTWAAKTKYPFVLFLYRPIALTGEILKQALSELAQAPQAGAVTLTTAGAQPSLREGFLLVRKADFQALGGFDGQETTPDIIREFCRRLGAGLGKTSRHITCTAPELIDRHAGPTTPTTPEEQTPNPPATPFQNSPATQDNQLESLKDKAVKRRNVKRLLQDVKLAIQYLSLLNERESDLKYMASEDLYGVFYPDVRDAVIRGDFTSCKQHYETFGKQEGRVYGLEAVLHRYEQNYSRVQSDTLAEAQLALNQGPTNLFPIVPFYFGDRVDEQERARLAGQTVGVHVHLYYADMLPVLADKLNHIPVPFDLFVSVRQDSEPQAIREAFAQKLTRAQTITVEAVPNRGRDIGPLIIQFGQRLLNYDYVLHIHTKQSLHNARLSTWGTALFDMLLGSELRVTQILLLLRDKAKIVYPEGQSAYFKDPTGWADNAILAREFLQTHTDVSIDEFPQTEFAEGSMYWARSRGIKDFLSLAIGWDDFPAEPIPPDGTLAHVLERLLFILAFKTPGAYFKICQTDSIKDYRYFEEEQDFRDHIVHKDVKVLAYYLPQFHPIPENDLWHGKGFTEWTKVKTATPLFAGHYQQHIPHPDLGYYLLDNPDVLRKQADMLHKAGLHGLIFYHYWFGGKMILEKPARMLLEHADIDLPFCFCWANENWTKCWDGNENDILLEQRYSESDAAGFIDYLIPFFQDPRYLRVDDRPMLFLYRPSSIPDPAAYLRVWRKHCAAAGLKAPYVVAVLTRGASDPHDYGMDAGVERVLHDWTNGQVPDIKELLDTYEDMTGSVLNYNEVADYYMHQPPTTTFSCFRSLVPNFDNTARYGAAAILTHLISPEKFQAWLEALLPATETLPEDRRFLVINAWNEWAEGSHLEPDTRFGYGFLNAIGRALSDRPFADNVPAPDALQPTCQVFLEIPAHLDKAMAADAFFKRKFVFNLAQSTLFDRCTVTTKPAFAAALRAARPDCPVLAAETPPDVDFTVQIRRLAFLAPDCLEHLLNAALSAPNSVILANTYDTKPELVARLGNGSVDSLAAYSNAVAILPPHHNGSFKLCTRARAFVTDYSTVPASSLPEVTTIVRIHPGYSITCLRNALLSLLAMHSCVVKPFLAVQNFGPSQRADLELLLATLFPSKHDYHIEFFDDAVISDLRCRMLNESVKMAPTRYVGFLDFDDLLLSDAYSFQLNGLRSTNKAFNFGRVFATNYYAETQELVGRNRMYEYGFSYEDFLTNNCIPLHSFLMDKERLDFDQMTYMDDMIYMEDYYFLMQLLTEDNANWDSLYLNHYVGDYIHTLDRAQSLACVDDEARERIVNSDQYKLCNKRIQDMRLQKQTALNRSAQ